MKNTVDLVHKKSSENEGAFYNQEHLTEKPINKLQDLYDIALEQNVDQKVHQLN